MSRRLWYPQLDVYDAIRRQGGLLGLWRSARPATPERLYISDFYLANPPLLHRTNMPREVRTLFTSLNIPKPNETFLNYPSPPVLFQKMEAVQRQALHTLTGKGLINLEHLARGDVQATPLGERLFEGDFARLLDGEERDLAEFIIRHFADPESCDIQQLRGRAGLRRAAL